MYFIAITLRAFVHSTTGKPVVFCPSGLIKKDIRVVLTINGIKIGIESQGDPGGRLIESLDLFVKLKCQLIICATRTRGKKVTAVKDLEKSGYKIIQYKQQEEPNESKQEDANIQKAKIIFEDAERFIKTV